MVVFAELMNGFFKEGVTNAHLQGDKRYEQNMECRRIILSGYKLVFCIAFQKQRWALPSDKKHLLAELMNDLES